MIIIPVSQRRKLRHTVAKRIAQCLTVGTREVLNADTLTPESRFAPAWRPGAHVWGLWAWECNSEFICICICSRNYRRKIYKQI